MVKKGPSCAEIQRRKGGPKRPTGDLRVELNKFKQCVPKIPPIWQVYSNAHDFFTLVNALHKCRKGLSIIDASNQPIPSGNPKRVTVIVASPKSVGRWALWFDRPDVFFLMVLNPKAEDPAIGDLLQCLHNVRVYVHTGDTKEGEITIGAGVAALNGCRVTFFSKADNSPRLTNTDVNTFHRQLKKQIAGGVGKITFMRKKCTDTPPPSV